jgi:hypothetical protein
MKAYYVENNGYDAIIIPETNQFWDCPSAKDIQLFASNDPNFPDWQGSYEASLENVEPNIVSVRKYWETFDDSIVIAENGDGAELTIHNQHAWNRRIEEMDISLPKAA